MKRKNQFFKKINNLSLQHKIISVFTVAIVIVSLVFLIGIQSIVGIHNKMLYGAVSNSLSASSLGIEATLKSADEVSFQIFCDSQIQSNLISIQKNTVLSEKEREFQNNISRKSIYEILSNYRNTQHSISACTILTEGYTVQVADFSTEFSLTPELREEIIAKAAVEKGRSVWIPVEGKGLFLARTIRKIGEFPLEDIGTLLIQINLDKMLRSTLEYSDMLEQSGIVLSSGDKLLCEVGEAVPQNEFASMDWQQNYGIYTVNGRRYFCVNRNIKEASLTVTCLLPYDRIYQPIMQTYTATFMSILLALVVVGWLSNQMLRAIMRDFQILIFKMDQFMGKEQEQNQELEIPDYSQREDELGLIHQHFDQMVEEIESLIKENYLKQIYIKEAQLKALKTQLHPHFLYNTLNIINWRAKLVGDQQISEITEALSNLLRSMLQDHMDCHTIKKELELVADYLTIQRYRFRNRLCYHQEVEPELEEVLVPKLIIQPLIENAIKYGVETNMYETNIYVNIFAEEDQICIYVKNDGSQFLEESMRQESSGFGIGLANIDKRIKLMFGENYGLSCYNEGEMAVVKMIVPLMAETKENGVTLFHA